MNQWVQVKYKKKSEEKFHKDTQSVNHWRITVKYGRDKCDMDSSSVNIFSKWLVFYVADMHFMFESLFICYQVTNL